LHCAELASGDYTELDTGNQREGMERESALKKRKHLVTDGLENNSLKSTALDDL